MADLPVAERDELRRRRLDRAQRPVERRQIDHVAAQVVRLRPRVRRLQAAHEHLGHVIDVLQVLPAAVGDVVRPAQASDLIALVGSLVMPKSRPTP